MDISYDSRKKVMRMEKRPRGIEERRDPKAELWRIKESTEVGTGCF